MEERADMEALRARHRDILERISALDRERQRERAERMAELEAMLAAKYGEPLGGLERLAAEARRALDEAAFEAARAEFGEHPLKPGTAVVEWALTEPRAGSKLGPSWVRTGAAGVVEIFGPGSACRGGHPPRIGELCVRPLKKDGTPARAAIRFRRTSTFDPAAVRLPDGWHPEGVDPNPRQSDLLDAGADRRK